jgi:hypothetical protein
MNYDIRIQGDEADNGLIEFDRLNLLTEHIKNIATKALMLNLGGFSGINPPKEIKKALAIRLQRLKGNRKNGTYLLLDCDIFAETLKSIQLHLFKPSEELLHMTPMVLVINAFRSALIEQEDKNNLDGPLLQSLLKFRKNFVSKDEVFYFSNRNSVPQIEVTIDDFKKIEHLHDSTPGPKKIVIHGKLDEMKYSKSKLVLITDEGPVNAFAQELPVLERITHYFGKEVTVSGLAHYKPGGRLSYVEMREFSEPGKTDIYFSHKPHAMGVKEQITLQLKFGKSKNPLQDIIGKWPGDESLEELLGMLNR